MSYTKMNNDLLSRIITSELSARQIRVLLFIIRQTSGFNRKTHLMSRSYIANAVDSDVSNVRKDIQKLLDAEFIYEIRNGKEVEIGLCNGVEIDPIGGVDFNPTDGVENNPIGGVKNNPQIKKVFKENNYNVLFDQFWNEYPRKNAKADAQKAFESAIKKAPFELILDGAKTFRKLMEQENRDVRYIKLPAGWLRSELWNDYQPVQTESKIVRIVTQNDSGAENHDRILEIYKHRERYLKQLQG